MKKQITLKRMIIALSAVAAAVVGSVFLIMYAQRDVEEEPEEITAPSQNAVLVTPKNYCSCGELMFAYVGKNNYLYNLDDESRPLIEQPVDELLYASDDTVLYTAPVETSLSHYGRESMIQELQIGENENTLYTIATVSIDPCWSSNDEVIYFVKDENKKQLCTFEPLTSTTEVAAEFEEEITGLRISSDGLLATAAPGKEMLYIPLSKQLVEPYCDCQGSRIIVCEQYDLILSPEGVLSYRWMGSNEAVQVAENVLVPCGYQDNEILYIQKTDEGVSLCAYFVSEEQNKELSKLADNILPQLTVSADYAFVMDDNFNVYRLLLDNNELSAFCSIDSSVKNPLISVFDYRLMVYDISKEADATFCYALDATVLPDEADAEKPVQAKAATTDESADYSGYTTLMMASAGENVSALQQKLYELGYLSSAPNGFFDVQTTVAVQYLQAALGMEETGIATPELQYRVNSEKLSEYSSNATLSSTEKGIRVRDLQARLKTLGYYKQAGSGEIDASTEQALTLFSQNSGLDYDGGIISSSLTELLFSADTAGYSGFIETEKGDICPAVTKLNQRLKELRYLTGSVNPCYDSKTQTAVTLYQQLNGISPTGSADKETLASLFAENAASCPDGQSPASVSDSLSATKGQVISDRQLKIIRKWLTKQFAVNHTDRQAVKRLQRQLVKLGYMQAENITMIYDKNTMDAVVAYQKAHDINADGIASKATLTDIFAATTKTVQEQ